jgi:RNA polymerase sigma-70 factor (ECF subfamily)
MGFMQTMDVISLDDASLLALIARGQAAARSDPLYEAALGVLYDRYGRLVYSIAIKVVYDVETAEEITQDVFVKVWENAHTYRAEAGKVSSWLIGITRHRAIDELRRQKSHPDKLNVSWLEEDAPDAFKTLLAEAPEEQVEKTLQEQTMQGILSGLPADQKKVLGLAFYKGLSHSQIASFLGEPVGTVKSRLRLAMEKLQKILSERGDFGP